MGSAEVIAYTDAIPHLELFDPEQCYTYWDIILTTDQGKDAIRDVFIFVEDEAKIKIDLIDDGGVINQERPGYRRIGEILIERGGHFHRRPGNDPQKQEASRRNARRGRHDFQRQG